MKIMHARCPRNLLLAAAILLLIGLLPVPGAQAKNMQCCAGDTCRCCGDTKNTPEQKSLMPISVRHAGDDCSCRSGPNPYGRDAAPATHYFEPHTKRLLHTIVFTAHYQHQAHGTSAHVTDKPPPRSIQCLYLFKSSLRI